LAGNVATFSKQSLKEKKGGQITSQLERKQINLGYIKGEGRISTAV